MNDAERRIAYAEAMFHPMGLIVPDEMEPVHWEAVSSVMALADVEVEQAVWGEP